jgi:Heparan-alpha-glucosaminide N-acetyltransferase, catalytic
MEQKKNTSGRLAFIDWTRGVGAVIMLQGHTFHSFTRTDLRDKGPYMLSQFVGGLPPALFLFLTGITFAFLMDSQEKREMSAFGKVLAALKRSRYLFLIAFLFRLQLYVFGFPTSPASELLRVDILNCMGMAMLILSPMAVFSTIERIRYCTVLTLLIAALSPVVSSIDVSHVPAFISGYFVPTYTGFGFFPWASFLAAGMVAGSVIRVVKREDLGKAMNWALAIGLGLIVVAYQLSEMPYSIYSKVDFWLDSPGLTFIKLGVVLVILAVAYLWVNFAVASRPSLFRQLGMTSLLVYWVHIELVYGRWFGVWKEQLSVGQVMTYTLVLMALMLLLSLLQTRGKDWWQALATPVPVPGGSSGD